MTDSDFLSKIDKIITDWHNCTIRKEQAMILLKAVANEFVGVKKDKSGQMKLL